MMQLPFLLMIPLPLPAETPDMTTSGRATFQVLKLVLAIGVCWTQTDVLDAAEPDRLSEVQLTSTLDQTSQPVQYWAPASAKTGARPLLVFLHSWGGNEKQDNSAWQKEAMQRDWIYVHPGFRGPNVRPQACGSELAQQDILDAIDWAEQEFKVDLNRVYLAGTSGGGHMSLMMAGRHPERFSAVSAWVPISDTVAWHDFHLKDGKPQHYAQNLEAVCGGPPGASAEVDAEYRSRSPVTWLAQVGELPVDINAGVHDGHTGSVPVAHSLNAFNVIAKAHGDPVVSQAEMDQLWQQKRLAHPQSGDTPADDSYQREIYLRRRTGPTRVTIFEGGHEGLPVAACRWLESQFRPARSK